LKRRFSLIERLHQRSLKRRDEDAARFRNSGDDPVVNSVVVRKTTTLFVDANPSTSVRCTFSKHSAMFSDDHAQRFDAACEPCWKSSSAASRRCSARSIRGVIASIETRFSIKNRMFMRACLLHD
jgi:hypothetical protein